MSIATNLHGRLRNTSLPWGCGLLPVFEAVGNAIHAIEDAGLPTASGRIKVEILRDVQEGFEFEGERKKPGPEAKGDIRAFKITDNGIGFTDENMTSFMTLDSEYKANRGGRGVGRLLWLKAFRHARISSVYHDAEGTARLRRFRFGPENGVTDEPTEDDPGSTRSTTVHLDGFVDRYRKAAPKTAGAIARDLFEHCLWYFVRPGGAPSLCVVDEDEMVDLHEVYDEHMVSGATPELLKIKDVDFELIHIKLSASSTRTHAIAFCAGNRLVEEESIGGKIPGLFGMLHDENGDFVYKCYVTSPLLDERVRSERTSFDIVEDPLELFSTEELSLKEIREAVAAKAAGFLAEYLEENKRKGRDRVNEFVSHKAPRYRPIIGRIPEGQLSVDPDISDRDLDLLLHRQLSGIESRLLAEGHDLMAPQENESYSEYTERLRDYLETVEDIKKSDLANYVFHRKVIIDLVKMAIRKKDDGTYENEDLIHNLIMPMRKDSNEVLPDDCNLWLVDERLAFHDYLASDKSLASMPITEASGGKEPDLLALNVFDNPILVSEGTKLPLASIVVVELKKPMRNDAAQGEEKDPIEQALGYLDKVRQGKVQTAQGRPIPESESIPGFCYVLCDLTPSVRKRCRLAGATPTADGLGYFLYNANYKAYVEVISLEGVVNAANERNRAFFDRLGLPTT